MARFRLEIGPSGIHGWGVYAAERIPARHKVIEYTGERISRRETKRRGVGPRTYLFTLDDYWTLDGAVGGSGAELINHSCDPNLYSCNFKGHILYMSRREIHPGEELTVDYRFSDKIDDVPCCCGSSRCRGTINLKTRRPGRSAEAYPSPPTRVLPSAKTKHASEDGWPTIPSRTK
jgi:SET domain-containing protein